MSKQGRFRVRASVARTAAGMVAAMLGALVLPVLFAEVASADTAPTTSDPVTVSADALPTVQVNGVVWAQTIVGSRVYATGEFTSARPAGAPSGVNETPRSNVLAYNLDTGELITSWSPTLNAQGLSITASADGRTIFVGGDFTSVSGVAKNRIVALNAATGAVVTGFTASVNSQVKALAVNGNTLYAGGGFTTAGGTARTRLAAFDATTGALLPWAPTADAVVNAITVLPTVNKVVVGGRLAKLNGTTATGMGALDGTTGGTLSWPVNTIAKNSGANAAITSLSTDGSQVYATGYTFGSGGNLESYVATDLNGKLVWASGCRGDTYGAVPVNGILYAVSHAHDCSSLGGHPQTEPWTFQRAMAVTTAVGGTNRNGTFNGRPAPKILQWFPTLSAGSYTGQVQAAWSVAANSKYVVMGGEFPSVNGSAQQGLVRMAVREVASDQQGPQGVAAISPKATSAAAGTVTLTWTSAWDRDNALLYYDVLRGSTVVGRVTGSSTFWTLPKLSFTDRTAPGGTTASYRIRATDAYGNGVTSAAVSVSVVRGTATAPANRAPVAQASYTAKYRTATFDGSASSDIGGGITSYSWAFGDGSTGTGATATHTYATTGSFPVTLTVTDTGGATATTSFRAGTTTPLNASPTASFRSAVTELSATFDASASADADGTVAAYAWDFGDGTTGTGVTATHAYARAGTYQVLLTVTDDAGDSSLSTATVTVTTTGGGGGTRTTIAADAFARTGTAGLGNADTGGAWSVSNTSLTSVSDGSARLSTAAGRSVTARLASVSSLETDLTTTVWTEAMPTGGGVYLATAARSTTSGDYRARVKIAADGMVSAGVTISSGTTETAIGSQGAISGLTYTAGTRLTIRTQVSGSGPTTIRLKVWKNGSTEPADWSRTVTDSTAGYQVAGGVAFYTYNSASAAATLLGRFDDLTATAGLRPENQAPAAAFTSGSNALAASFDGSTSTDADGTVASYAWDFGDGSTGTGVAPTHTYAAAGSYRVMLTVTDNAGASTSLARVVTVTTATPVGVLAADTFARTVAAGFGTADTGGAWTTSGSTSSFSVADGSARVVTPAAGTAIARLAGTTVGDTDVTSRFWTEALPTGGGYYYSTQVRRSSTGDYRAKVLVTSAGKVQVQLSKVVGGTETSLATAQTVTGLTLTPGAALKVRVTATGSSPTTLSIKVWAGGSAEPATAQQTVTDGTAGMQDPGTVGLIGYVSGSATAPVTAHYDDLIVR